MCCSLKTAKAFPVRLKIPSPNTLSVTPTLSIDNTYLMSTDSDPKNKKPLVGSTLLHTNPMDYKYSTYQDKKRDLSEFFFHEHVEHFSLPWWCPSCGFLNPRDRPPLTPGWSITRMFCVICETERVGYWLCTNCFNQNSIQPYETKWGVSMDPPPPHQCLRCLHSTRKIQIFYPNGVQMTAIEEMHLIYLCKQNRSQEFRNMLKIKNETEGKESNPDRVAEKQSVCDILSKIPQCESLQDVKNLIDLEKLTLPSSEIIEALSKLCRKRIVDLASLWFLLNKKIVLQAKDDWGNPITYWPRLSIWFQENPDIVEVCLFGLQYQHIFPFVILEQIIYYAFGYSDCHEKTIRKWVKALYEVTLHSGR